MLTCFVCSKAQNLVPNGSFEYDNGVYDFCELSMNIVPNGIFFLTGNWFAPNKTSSDIHDTTAPCKLNFYDFGAKPGIGTIDGKRCGGIFVYPMLDSLYNGARAYSDYMEFLSNKLIEPIKKKRIYIVKYYYLGSVISFYNIFDLAIRLSSNKPDIYFDRGSNLFNRRTGLPFYNLGYEDLRVNQFDSIERWSLAHHCIIPKETYNYITIGNFTSQKAARVIKNIHYDDTAFKKIAPLGVFPYTYVFIDSVSITPLDIEGYAPLELGPRDTLLCQGEPLHYDLSHIKATFRWQDGSSSPYYTITEAGTYWVEMTIGPDCKDSDTITVRYLNTKLVIEGARAGCEGVPLTLSSPAQGTIWQDSIAAQQLKVDQAGKYFARSPLAPCQPSDTVEIDFRPCNLSIPNVFTPNSDQANQTWHPQGLELAGDWQLVIFNRWGKSVYQSKKYDGSWDGDSLPEGVYYYHLQSAHAALEYRGWVLLKR